ncbi:hypothetical protein TNCV_2845591 [Trichonephila clavipes]|nr:hypothetical protein TNCV_2845591 [Trichonephila clavipes]
MFDPSPFANPTPLAQNDTSRDVIPRVGTSHAAHQWQYNRLNYQSDKQIFSQCVWDHPENNSAVMGNCSPDRNIRFRKKDDFGSEKEVFYKERKNIETSCQVIYSQFGLAIHQNDHQARRRFVEWAQNEIAVVPDFHKRILFSNEAHFWLNGYVNKQNCRIWSEANPQVYVETPLHPEKLTAWCALWAGGILLQKR